MRRPLTAFERPFELLKLIRDGFIRNRRDLRIPDSRFNKFIYQFEAQLAHLGLIEIDEDGNLKTTALLAEFSSALNLSLTQLSSYHENSVICSPIFGFPTKPPLESEVLVLMPFTNEMRPVYDDHIKAVASELGLSTARADDFFTADSIVGDIWNAINSCRVIVADCTGRNPNVFYEIGIAHTLGKPVILIAQTTNDIPFDVRHIRTIVYEFKPRGMQEFEAALRSTLDHELSIPASIEDLIRRRSLVG